MMQEGNCPKQELKREQKRAKKAERQKEEWDTSSKDKQPGGIEANIAKTSSLAKETEDASIAGSNRTCSNRRSRENKCRNDDPLTESRVWKLIYHGCRQEEEQELLQLQRI